MTGAVDFVDALRARDAKRAELLRTYRIAVAYRAVNDTGAAAHHLAVTAQAAGIDYSEALVDVAVMADYMARANNAAANQDRARALQARQAGLLESLKRDPPRSRIEEMAALAEQAAIVAETGVLRAEMEALDAIRAAHPRLFDPPRSQP